MPESQEARRGLPPKSADFMEWYNEVVELAELTDKRYPIKGMNIWRPYGQRIMSQIDAFTRAEMARTGHDEVSFPLLIPEKLFMKEADQIKGFGGEVFWVTHAGHNALPDGERWVVRPTSECAMYEIFPLWVRSHGDLPLQTYQICNVFRYETKQTRAFMRVREIHFFEDHSVFATEEEARAHVALDLDIVRNVYDRLAITALYTKRPEWDKFPGAVESTGGDVIMPSGKVLQCATVHYYGTNFAKAYGMTYEAPPSDDYFAELARANARVADLTFEPKRQRLRIQGHRGAEEDVFVVYGSLRGQRFVIVQASDEQLVADIEWDGSATPFFHQGDCLGTAAVGQTDQFAPGAGSGYLEGVENYGIAAGQVVSVFGTDIQLPQWFTHKFCHQTTYGMSERLVGAVVGCHGDDAGLILPPEVAPHQVVIVPVLFKGETESILAYCRDVADRLAAAGLRVKLDDRDRSSGEKYFHWETRGVPLRLEIGPKDMEKKSVFAARRDVPGRDGKSPIALDDLESGVRALLEDIQGTLRARQEAFAKDRIRRVATLDEARAIDEAEELDVVFEMPISGDAAAQQVEEALDIKTLGVPVDVSADASGEKCAVTGEPATTWIRFARTY